MTLQPCNVWLQNIVIIEVKNAMLGQVGTAFFVLSFQVSRLRLINDIQIYNDWSCWGTWPRLAWSWSTPMTTILIILRPGTLLISCTIRTVITTHQRLWMLHAGRKVATWISGQLAVYRNIFQCEWPHLPRILNNYLLNDGLKSAKLSHVAQDAWTPVVISPDHKSNAGDWAELTLWI